MFGCDLENSRGVARDPNAVFVVIFMESRRC